MTTDSSLVGGPEFEPRSGNLVVYGRISLRPKISYTEPGLQAGKKKTKEKTGTPQQIQKEYSDDGLSGYTVSSLKAVLTYLLTALLVIDN